MLELVVRNTDEDLQRTKIDKERIAMCCPRCDYRYMSTVGAIVDDPLCPRCGAEVC